MWGGMGAGDVKALAALGAWLGLRRTVYLFVFMGISGGVLMLAVLWWRGLLWAHIRRLGVFLWNRLLSQSSGSLLPAASSKDEGIPYGLALALGMALLCWRRF
jgi:prepilin peptidase CpaA